MRTLATGSKRPVRVGRAVGQLPSAALREQLTATPSDVLVGTLRTVVEYLDAGVLSPGLVRTVVVDEVDFCHAPAMRPTLVRLLQRAGVASPADTSGPAWPAAANLLLVSATVPPDVRALATQYLRPGYLDTTPSSSSATADGGGLPSSLVHMAVRPAGTNAGAASDADDAALFRRWYAHVNQPGSATGPARGVLVFCQSQARLEHLRASLRKHGLLAAALQADGSKEDRRRALNRLALGKVNLLLATDMASRGLDLPRLSHVYHYDFPLSANAYVHRAGRVGRVRPSDGADGYSISPGTVVSVARSDADVARVRAWTAPTACTLLAL